MRKLRGNIMKRLSTTITHFDGFRMTEETFWEEGEYATMPEDIIEIKNGFLYVTYRGCLVRMYKASEVSKIVFKYDNIS